MKKKKLLNKRLAWSETHRQYKKNMKKKKKKDKIDKFLDSNTGRIIALVIIASLLMYFFRG